MNLKNSTILPMVIAFVVITLAIIASVLLLPLAGIDYMVLLFANALFCLTSLVVFNMQRKAMDNLNPNVFIRTVMVGVMLKMLVCLAFVIGYVLLTRPNFNRPAIYLSLLVYLVYLVTEVAIVMKLNKRKHA